MGWKVVVLVLVVVSEGFLRPESRQRLAAVGPDARARARAKCTLCLRAHGLHVALCALGIEGNSSSSSDQHFNVTITLLSKKRQGRFPVVVSITVELNVTFFRF